MKNLKSLFIGSAIPNPEVETKMHEETIQTFLWDGFNSFWL